MNIMLTVLSAVMAHSAYTWPTNIGFLWIAAGFVWYWVLSCGARQKNIGLVVSVAVRLSALWGLFFFSLHFSWLYTLLRVSSHATFWGAIALVSLVIVNFMAIFMLCSLVVSLGIFMFSRSHYSWLASLGWFVIVVGFYDYVLTQWSIWFTGQWRGYPLLSVWLPLIGYKLFAHIFMMWASFWGIGTTPKIDESSLSLPAIAYISPSKTDHARHIASDIDQAYERYGKTDSILMLAPESTVPFSLNRREDVVAYWQRTLLPGTDLIIGGFRRGDHGCCHQSVYHIDAAGVRQVYDKQHCMPFNERVPKVWHNVSWAHSLFLADATPITVGSSDQVPVFSLKNKTYILPVICSELFDKRLILKRKRQVSLLGKKISAIVWLVNDSWFVARVKRLLYAYATYAALDFNSRVIYVGHDTKDRQRGLEEPSLPNVC